MYVSIINDIQISRTILEMKVKRQEQKKKKTNDQNNLLEANIVRKSFELVYD